MEEMEMERQREMEREMEMEIRVEMGMEMELHMTVAMEVRIQMEMEMEMVEMRLFTRLTDCIRFEFDFVCKRTVFFTFSSSVNLKETQKGAALTLSSAVSPLQRKKLNLN